MEKHTVEIFFAMNEDGDFYVGNDKSEASDGLTENCGALMIRIVKLTVRMAAPEVEDGPQLDIPDDAGKTTKTEVEAE